MIEKTGVTDPECDRIPGRLFTCTSAALKNLISDGSELPDLVQHRGSVAVPEYNNPDLIPARMYPTLFPAGVGGFDIPDRICPISFANQAKCCLDLAHPPSPLNLRLDSSLCVGSRSLTFFGSLWANPEEPHTRDCTVAKDFSIALLNLQRCGELQLQHGPSGLPGWRTGTNRLLDVPPHPPTSPHSTSTIGLATYKTSDIAPRNMLAGPSDAFVDPTGPTRCPEPLNFVRTYDPTVSVKRAALQIAWGRIAEVTLP